MVLDTRCHCCIRVDHVVGKIYECVIGSMGSAVTDNLIVINCVASQNQVASSRLNLLLA